MDDPQPESETGGGTRYVKVRTVGKGAFGTAVLYRKEPEGSLVVIKQVPVLELSATERVRALNEARVLALLSHRNVVRYLGSWERDGCLLLEMEFAGGGTMAQFLAARTARNAALSERRALALFSQVASAIRHMHAHNVLHRDLKTENIFLTKDNVVKVGDFGISKVMGTQVQAETVLGTPYYLSPEMCEGLQYDQKSDVWALGCVLYELLALRRAFSAPSLPALVRRIVAADYPPPPTRYSAGTRGLLSSLLQTDPGVRPSANVIEDQLLPPLQAAANLSTDADSLDGTQGPCARSVVFELRASNCFVSLTPVALPARAALRELAVSKTHCVALTQEQVVFTWDVVDWRGGASFSAGLESWRKPQHQPQCVDALTGLGITRVGAGDGFSVFASDSGAVLTCGDGAEGCLGHGDYSHCVRPRLVEKLLAADVVALAVGPSHVLALGGDGCLHAWGRGKHGRLGLGHQQDALLPAAVPLPQGAVVRSVHAGPDCSAVVSTAGELLLAGDNSSGKLAPAKGLRTKLPGWLGGAGRGPWLRFRAVHLPEPVRDVWLAEDHVAALTDTGRLLALGDGAPGPSAAQPDRTFAMASAGPTYTVASTPDNVLFFWGRWADGKQVGVPSGSGTQQQVGAPAPTHRELLALYASPQQVERGEGLSVAGLFALPCSVLLHVSTCVPLARMSRVAPGPVEDQGDPADEDGECDSLGPIPDWLQEELAQSENQWEGPQ
ncbi:serine/threonine-protein kinase Nek8-like [Frankliniella occidentalis]|uniref:non-specific serine/threonine protein kinase n=1 Tax=Frankliniella occidentalis TaxID=133901 RepID=A0A9C6X3A7_FRAOC|nr:serine/threonine-protein kinase Nek8-like [Frankliniella occidentalis]